MVRCPILSYNVLISLVESQLILPNHLSHLHGPDWEPTGPVDRFFAKVQGVVDRMLDKFLEGPLDRGLRYATTEPVITFAAAIGLLIVCISLVPAGIVKTTFADVVEGDFVTASLEMPDGTTAQRTYEVARELEAAGHRVIEQLSSDRVEGAPSLLSRCNRNRTRSGLVLRGDGAGNLPPTLIL